MAGNIHQGLVSVFALLFVVLVIPTQGLTASNKEKPTVAVVNYPLKYFVERIGGDRVNVVFPIPHGVDPAFWVPEPNGVLVFQSANLVLLNGATYSKWLDKVSLARRKLVNTSESFKHKYIAVKGWATHNHGPQGAHAHARTAFTTWLDFRLAAQQAEAVRAALEKIAPQEMQQFVPNFQSLMDDLIALDRSIQGLVEGKHPQPFIASHPVYDYFARRYGLNIQSVLWEPQEFPSAQQWTQLESILKAHPAKWVIWEGKPNPRTVAKLKSMDVGSLVFDPSGNVPTQGDFMSVMRENIGNLKTAF